jgi:chemotaxis protein CheD
LASAPGPPPASDEDVEELAALLSSGRSEWLMVDVGSVAVSNSTDDVLSTSAPVGSCVAVCLWEADAQVSGLLHFLLPDSKSDPAAAESKPAAFADTGLMLLLDEATRFGARKSRCKVWLVGGAQVGDREGSDKLAKRNVLAARSALWKAGILLDREEVGGTKPRKATLSVAGGQLFVKVEELEH